MLFAHGTDTRARTAMARDCGKGIRRASELDVRGRRALIETFERFIHRAKWLST